MLSPLMRAIRAYKKRFIAAAAAPLTVELLERDSRYVSHGTLTVYSPSEERELEIEFRVNRPEFLDSPNEKVIEAIAAEVADFGYRLRSLLLHRPAGWHLYDAHSHAANDARSSIHA